MNQFGVILALIFSLIIAIFAIANHQPVVVNYLYGTAEVSAVLVILGSAILGALVMFLLSLIRQVKANFRIRSLRNEVEELKENLKTLEGEKDALLAQVGQLQEAGADLGTSRPEGQEQEGITEEDRLDVTEEETGIHAGPEDTDLEKGRPEGIEKEEDKEYPGATDAGGEPDEERENEEKDK